MWNKPKNIPEKKSYKPYILDASTAQAGLVLRVHPKIGSHFDTPYLVEISDSCKEYFKTKLLKDFEYSKEGTERIFRYDCTAWEPYHSDRFEFVARSREEFEKLKIRS